MTQAETPIGLGLGLVFRCTQPKISLCQKKKIQTDKPNFTFENTTFSPKPHQKPGKNKKHIPTIGIARIFDGGGQTTNHMQ